MVSGIRLFREKLKSAKYFGKIIAILIAIVFSIYIFSFCSFGGRPKLFIVTYPILALLIILVSLYSFAYYEKIREKMSWNLLPPLIFILLVFITTLIGTRDYAYLKTISLLTATTYLSFLCFVCFKRLKLILYLISAPIFIFSIYYIIHYLPNLLHYSGQRLGSFFGNENDVGLNLFFGFAFSMVLGIPYKQYWMIPVSIIILFASITTGSKKVILLSFFFLLFLIFVLLRKKKLFLLIGLVSVVVISIIVLSLPVFADIRKRLISGIPLFGNLSADASSVNRFLFFKTSFYLGTKSFLFGYGGGGFAKFSGVGVYSHNNLGEILCDFGIFGILSFYILYPVIAFFTNKKNINHVLVIFTFLGSFIFCSFTAIYFDTKIYYVLLALSLYLISSNQKKIIVNQLNINTYCEITI